VIPTVPGGTAVGARARGATAAKFILTIIYAHTPGRARRTNVLMDMGGKVGFDENSCVQTYFWSQDFLSYNNHQYIE
jgi:hypothetical protein